MRIALTLAALTLAAPAFGAIEFVAVSTSPTAGSSPTTWNIDAGAASNRAVVVNCVGGNISADVSISALTVGGNAATFVQSHLYISGSVYFRNFQYVYLGPSTGSVEVSVSHNAPDNSLMNCGALSFSGVAQSNAVDVSSSAINTDYTETPWGPEYTTTVADTMLVDLAFQTSGNTMTAESGQTIRYNFNNTTQGVRSYGANKDGGAAGTKNQNWLIAGIVSSLALKGASGGGDPVATNTLGFPFLIHD